MSDAKHTPGPWKRNHLTVRAEINGVHVAEVSEPHRSIRGSERREDMEYCRGNALLIAAAPDLLAALQAARRDYIDTNGIAIPEEQHSYPLLVQMDTAIAKATGK